jgi:putative flippase GtrA
VLRRAIFSREPGRYLFVGVLCAVLNNAILILGDWSGLHYLVSVLLTFVLVLPMSYLAHAWWTFRASASWLAFGRFMAGSISSLIVASLAVGALRGGLGLPMIVSAPLATVAMIVYNFVMTRWAVRGRKSAFAGTAAALQLDEHDVAEAA